MTLLDLPLTDQLARVMSLREKEIDIRLHNSAYPDNKEIINEYSSFLNITDPILLTGEKTKNINTNIYYRNIEISISDLESFTNHFSSWK